MLTPLFSRLIEMSFPGSRVPQARLFNIVNLLFKRQIQDLEVGDFYEYLEMCPATGAELEWYEEQLGVRAGVRMLDKIIGKHFAKESELRQTVDELKGTKHELEEENSRLKVGIQVMKSSSTAKINEKDNEISKLKESNKDLMNQLELLSFFSCCSPIQTARLSVTQADASAALEDDYDEDEATVGETSIEEEEIPSDFGRLPGLENLRDDHESSTGHTLSLLVRARRSRIPSNRNNTSEFGSNEMEWSYDEAEEIGSAQGKSGVISSAQEAALDPSHRTAWLARTSTMTACASPGSATPSTPATSRTSGTALSSRAASPSSTPPSTELTAPPVSKSVQSTSSRTMGHVSDPVPRSSELRTGSASPATGPAPRSTSSATPSTQATSRTSGTAPSSRAASPSSTPLSTELESCGKECLKCKKRFRNNLMLKKHYCWHFQMILGKKFQSSFSELKCLECNKDFTSKHKLLVHIGIVHDKINQVLKMKNIPGLPPTPDTLQEEEEEEEEEEECNFTTVCQVCL